MAPHKVTVSSDRKLKLAKARRYYSSDRLFPIRNNVNHLQHTNNVTSPIWTTMASHALEVQDEGSSKDSFSSSSVWSTSSSTSSYYDASESLNSTNSQSSQSRTPIMETNKYQSNIFWPITSSAKPPAIVGEEINRAIRRSEQLTKHFGHLERYLNQLEIKIAWTQEENVNKAEDGEQIESEKTQESSVTLNSTKHKRWWQRFPCFKKRAKIKPIQRTPHIQKFDKSEENENKVLRWFRSLIQSIKHLFRRKSKKKSSENV